MSLRNPPVACTYAFWSNFSKTRKKPSLSRPSELTEALVQSPRLELGGSGLSISPFRRLPPSTIFSFVTLGFVGCGLPCAPLSLSSFSDRAKAQLSRALLPPADSSPVRLVGRRRPTVDLSSAGGDKKPRTESSKAERRRYLARGIFGLTGVDVPSFAIIGPSFNMLGFDGSKSAFAFHPRCINLSHAQCSNRTREYLESTANFKSRRNIS